MKRFLYIGVVIVIICSMLILLTGCSNNKEQSNNVKKSNTTLASQVKVGDYVSYNAGNSTYTSIKQKNGKQDQTFTVTGSEKWRVVNINDDGTVDLISEKGLGTKDDNTFAISSGKGYANAIEELNNICNIYGNGTNAISARSMTYKDAIKIIGIDKIAQNFNENLSNYKTEEEKISRILQLLANKNDQNPNNNYGNNLTVDPENNYIPSANDKSGYERQNTVSGKDNYIHITHIEKELIDNKDTMSLLVGTENNKGCWLATDFKQQAKSYPANKEYITFGLYYTIADLNSLRDSSISPTKVCTSFKQSGIDQTNFYIRPVVTLNKNTMTTGGDGSISNPYLLEGNNNVNVGKQESNSNIENEQNNIPEAIKEQTNNELKVNGYTIKYGTYKVKALMDGQYENQYDTTLVINEDGTCIFTEKRKDGTITETKKGTITIKEKKLVISTDKPSSGCMIDDSYTVTKDNNFTSDIWEFSYHSK